MPVGLWLILFVLALYIGAMVVLWQYLRGPKIATPFVTEVPLALKEGQTIVGIGCAVQARHRNVVYTIGYTGTR